MNLHREWGSENSFEVDFDSSEFDIGLIDEGEKNENQYDLLVNPNDLKLIIFDVR